jgi:hypothetical protein
MQSFFSRKDEFDGRIANGIIAVALLGGIAVKGFAIGRWLAGLMR